MYKNELLVVTLVGYYRIETCFDSRRLQNERLCLEGQLEYPHNLTINPFYNKIRYDHNAAKKLK